MSDIQSVFRQHNPLEQLIDQLIEAESDRKYNLIEQKEAQVERQSAVSDVGTKLSSLNSTISDFQNPFASKFDPLDVTSTNENAFNLIMDEAGLAEPGDYDINVDNLAQRDIVLSDSINNEDGNLTNQVIEFDMSMGGETRTISVDTEEAEDNREALDLVTSEINAQFDDLDEGLSARVFDVDGETSQISIKSDESGSDNQITIQNTNAAADELGLANLYNEDDLNARFTIDGVDFTRQTNTVDDVIDGVTVELMQETGNERISVVRDQEEALANVQGFIEEYNEVNSFIRQQTFLNGESGDRGPLQRDRMFRTLMQDLRLEMTSSFGSNLSEEDQEDLPELSFNTLMDIGINFRQNGEMYIEDEGQLEDALQANPDEVQEFFTHEDAGILSRAELRIDDFISGSDSVINSLENTIDQRIDHYENRVEREERRLETRRDQLRDEFTQMQQVMIEAQNQMQRMQAIGGQMGMGGAEQMMMMQ